MSFEVKAEMLAADLGLEDPSVGSDVVATAIVILAHLWWGEGLASPQVSSITARC